MNEDRPGVRTSTISLYPDEWAAFWSIAKDNGLASMTAAIRFVLNFYRKAHGGNGVTFVQEDEQEPVR